MVSHGLLRVWRIIWPTWSGGCRLLFQQIPCWMSKTHFVFISVCGKLLMKLDMWSFSAKALPTTRPISPFVINETRAKYRSRFFCHDWRNKFCINFISAPVAAFVLFISFLFWGAFSDPLLLMVDISVLGPKQEGFSPNAQTSIAIQKLPIPPCRPIEAWVGDDWGIGTGASRGTESTAWLPTHSCTRILRTIEHGFLFFYV